MLQQYGSFASVKKTGTWQSWLSAAHVPGIATVNSVSWEEIEQFSLEKHIRPTIILYGIRGVQLVLSHKLEVVPKVLRQRDLAIPVSIRCAELAVCALHACVQAHLDPRAQTKRAKFSGANMTLHAICTTASWMFKQVSTCPVSAGRYNPWLIILHNKFAAPAMLYSWFKHGQCVLKHTQVHRLRRAWGGLGMSFAHITPFQSASLTRMLHSGNILL